MPELPAKPDRSHKAVLPLLYCPLCEQAMRELLRNEGVTCSVCVLNDSGAKKRQNNSRSKLFRSKSAEAVP